MPKEATGSARIETLRQVLLERRQQVLKDVDTLLAQRRSGQGRLREDSVPDAGDMAIHDTSGDEQISLLEARDRTRQQLDEALRKLDEGTYGICEECGRPISEGRLKALPFAQRCVACQEKAETIARVEKEKDRKEI
jgi:DnaK suppressor protein